MEALRRAIDAGKDRGSRTSRPAGEWENRLSYFSWKADDVKVLRFLTDDIKINLYAEFVLSTDGKSQNFLVDPDNNLVKKYGGKTREKYIDPSSPLIEPPLRERAALVAVLREERSLGGGRTEVVDAVTERSSNNQQFPARTFGIVRQGLRNFWQQVMEYGNRYGTFCDRDYVVKRIGGGLDTTYSILACEPIDALRDLKDVQAHYGYGKKWNAADPDRFLYCPQTIDEWVEYYGGEDRVKHFLVGNDAPAPASSSFAAYTDEAQAAPSPGGTDFASLRDRLIPHAK
jgi:hypothetical protein